MCQIYAYTLQLLIFTNKYIIATGSGRWYLVDEHKTNMRTELTYMP